MKQLLIVVLSFVGIAIQSNAQTLPVKLPNADFKNAIEITDSIYGPTNVSLGYGEEMELPSNYPTTKEINSAWFKFTAKYDTLITFDLVALDSMDDYDFIIFKCPNKDCIKGIKTGKIQPDRINWAYNSRMCFYEKHSKSKCLTTGLSKCSSKHELYWLEETTYTASLPVKKGETCYIMVNNCYYPKTITECCKKFPKGFMLYFYDQWPGRKPVVLNNVLFETGKSILLKKSSTELDKLVAQLKFNVSMKIEIRGHTDNQGVESKNQKLAEDRAKAVMDYIISKGIAAYRINYVGYGSRLPITTNDNEEGREKNRRVEFTVLCQ